jgi:PAS domain S-box-containing protein
LEVVLLAQEHPSLAVVSNQATKRKGAEAKVRQSDEIFRLLVESVQDYAIFLLDTQGNVNSWNAGAERLKGYKAEEIIGQHFSRFYPQEARESHWPERELEIAAKEGRFTDEGWRIRKDGSTFWASVVITALRDEDGELRGFSKVTRDLTERRNSEERTQELNKELRPSFWSRGVRSRCELWNYKGYLGGFCTSKTKSVGESLVNSTTNSGSN